MNHSYVPSMLREISSFWEKRRETVAKRIAQPRKHIPRNPSPGRVLCNFWRRELRISESSAPPFQENQSSCERGDSALRTMLRFHLPATRWYMSLMIERVLPLRSFRKERQKCFCWISDNSSSLPKVVGLLSWDAPPLLWRGLHNWKPLAEI